MGLVCKYVWCLWLFSLLALGQGGTASLTGKLIDITGAGVSRVRVELESEQAPSKNILSNGSDANGEWSFPGLLPGEYMFSVVSPGFQTLRVRGIRVTDGEHKTLPPLELKIAAIGCVANPVVQYIRFLDDGTRTGDFGGRIQIDEGPLKGDTQGIPAAEVKLLCGKDRVCGTTKTDENGEYHFTGVNPGVFDLEVTRTGFYRQKEAGYKVEVGRESMYYPIYLEKCVRGNCDPSKRPKRVILCE